MPTRTGPPLDLHGGSLFWDRDSAPTRCAACSCWPEAGGTDVPLEPCACEGLRPSLFHLPLQLSSSFLLPKAFSFFLHFSPAIISLPSSFCLWLNLYIIILDGGPSSGDWSCTLSLTEWLEGQGTWKQDRRERIREDTLILVSTNILKTQDGVQGLVLSRKSPWPFHVKASLKCWCFWSQKFCWWRKYECEFG